MAHAYSSSSSSATAGISLLPLLTVLFVGLKLTGYIAWSWWLVLAPTWIPIVIAALVVIVIVLAVR